MNGSVEQSIDFGCQEQKLRKMALKDELREKVLSMHEKAQRDSLALRQEVQELRKEKEKVVKERMNQKNILEEHMDCDAKVASGINPVLRSCINNSFITFKLFHIILFLI